MSQRPFKPKCIALCVIAIVVLGGYMAFWATWWPSDIWTAKFWSTPHVQVYADDMGDPRAFVPIMLFLMFAPPMFAIVMLAIRVMDCFSNTPSEVTLTCG